MPTSQKGTFTLLLTASSVCGTLALYMWPFPEENAVLQLVALKEPWLLYGIKYAYLGMLYTTPYISLSVLASLAYIFAGRSGKKAGTPKLPPYQEAAARTE